jgi:hypothetical protein
MTPGCERRHEAMLVVVRLVDRQIVHRDHALELLCDSREDPLRVVLGLERKRSATQRVRQALRRRQCGMWPPARRLVARH